MNQLARRTVEEASSEDDVPSGHTVDRHAGTYNMDFGVITVSPESSANLHITALHAARIRCLLIPKEIGVNFNMVGFLVGTTEQFNVLFGEVSARSFSDSAFYVNLGFSACEAGEQITLMVRNITKQPQKFQANIIGDLLTAWVTDE